MYMKIYWVYQPSTWYSLYVSDTNNWNPVHGTPFTRRRARRGDGRWCHSMAEIGAWDYRKNNTITENKSERKLFDIPCVLFGDR